MSRTPKVTIAFDFDPMLVVARRIAAPHANYCGTNKYWKTPASEAAAFVELADMAMKTAGRTATVSIDWRHVTVGIPAAPADAPAFLPSI